ncbi:Non-motile and phage-resistance protein, partial [Durusdinium trenchii]
MIHHEETIRVLLVEDDAEDHRLFSHQLNKSGYHIEVDWAETLAEAIDELRHQTYDVVMSDLSLPDSRPQGTIANLKGYCARTPIVVLTSMDDEVMERQLMAAGAQGYLVKGEFGGRALGRTIVHAIQRQESINEVNALVRELEHSQRMLQEHSKLLHQKNARLKKLYRTAQEFVDNVSHDFRTPLTVIKDYVSIISEGMVGEINEEQQKLLSKVAVRADDLNNMVDDLLDVSKLESDLLGAWRRNVWVEEILERAESLLRLRAGIQGVELVTECEPDLPAVYCDAEKVGRVLTNLAVNAIKFCDSGGIVKLWAKADPSHHQVILGVTDNGPGIDQESLRDVFKRFKQSDEHVKNTSKGFGLGLSIARQLCRLNLGELQVESKVGDGSTFSFNLPVANPVEVLSRWLELDSGRIDTFKLIEIVAEDVSAAPLGDFDNFLNCLLRNHDLLLRVGVARWMLVMAVSPSESSQWFERMRKEFDRVNRNRPLGALPSYRAEIRCEWKASDSKAQLLEKFKDLVGFEADIAEDGQQGIESARNLAPSAILLDVLMPQKDGMTTLAELRADFRTVGIPVIMLSASLRNEQRALD